MKFVAATTLALAASASAFAPAPSASVSLLKKVHNGSRKRSQESPDKFRENFGFGLPNGDSIR